MCWLTRGGRPQRTRPLGSGPQGYGPVVTTRCAHTFPGQHLPDLPPSKCFLKLNKIPAFLPPFLPPFPAQFSPSLGPAPPINLSSHPPILKTLQVSRAELKGKAALGLLGPLPSCRSRGPWRAADEYPKDPAEPRGGPQELAEWGSFCLGCSGFTFSQLLGERLLRGKLTGPGLDSHLRVSGREGKRGQ